MRLTRRNKVWPAAVFFDVGAADAAPADSELDLTISRRGRRRDVVDPHIAARMPSNCPHYTSLSGRCSEAVNVRTLRGVMFSSRCTSVALAPRDKQQNMTTRAIVAAKLPGALTCTSPRIGPGRRLVERRHD